MSKILDSYIRELEEISETPGLIKNLSAGISDKIADELEQEENPEKFKDYVSKIEDLMYKIMNKNMEDSYVQEKYVIDEEFINKNLETGDFIRKITLPVYWNINGELMKRLVSKEYGEFTLEQLELLIIVGYFEGVFQSAYGIDHGLFRLNNSNEEIDFFTSSLNHFKLYSYAKNLEKVKQIALNSPSKLFIEIDEKGLDISKKEPYRDIIIDFIKKNKEKFYFNGIVKYSKTWVEPDNMIYD
ncbi:MAG: hypothetical protein ACOCXG_04675 [Nanoarchaeota archaeon]